MKKSIIQINLLILFSISIFKPSFALTETNPSSKIQLPKIFGDHMVLQQGIQIPVWGKAESGEEITVQLGKNKASTKAGESGNWKVHLKPMTQGGPYILSISGKEKIEFKDVLIGEVWLASGQSNMEMPVGGWGKIIDYENIIMKTNDPEIRFLVVNHSISPNPKSDINTNGWRACDSTTMDYHSAAAYFFAKELQVKLNCPVGIIQSTWGGTKIQAWMSDEGINGIDEMRNMKANMEPTPPDFQTAVNEYSQKTTQWYKDIIDEDKGYKEGEWLWAEPNVNTQLWKSIPLPQYWEEAGIPSFDGVIWFRKEIQIPESWEGKDLSIHLSAIDDHDMTWFNGTIIGTTHQYDKERVYKIPANLVKKGDNHLVVRVFDTGGAGGFKPSPENFYISSDDPGFTLPSTISLVGDWNYNTGFDLQKIKPIPMYPNYPSWFSCLYNAMINPVVPYGIQGAIWYQGESDAGNAKLYQKSFPGMIKDWRKQWNQGDFPFLFVQLANFMERQKEPSEDGWAELREAQTMTLSTPNTGMAVAIDIGDAKDIHPKNKKEVGHRLALVARNQVYKENILSSGPLFDAMKIDKNKIIVSFKYTGSGLTVKNGNELKGFAIAGKDKKYYWAEANIEKDTVIVSSPKVPEPVYVRYGWAANPECNLYNNEGLPAVPFRTDQ